MEAKAWRGGTFGIRVGRKNAEKYFDKKWRNIEVEVNGQFHSFDLPGTFWTTCPEFRGGVIKDWLAEHGLLRWPKGHPPKVELTLLDGNRFRLSLSVKVSNISFPH